MKQSSIVLALCARSQGHPVFYDRLAGLLDKFEEWESLPAEAEKHGMAPLLYRHLCYLGATIPQSVRWLLVGLNLKHRHADQVRRRTLSEILERFEAEGITTLLLKGMALAYLVYPEPSLRTMSDIDLLVDKTQIKKAHQLLTALRFEMDPSPGWKPDGFNRRAYSKLVDHLPISVEMHYPTHFSFPFHGGINQSYRSRMNRGREKKRSGETFSTLISPPLSFALNGIKVRTLGLEDTLLYLRNHLQRHVVRYIWVADIVSWAEHYEEKIDWDRLNQEDPSFLGTLFFLHGMTPLTENLWRHSSKKHLPRSTGFVEVIQGWPQLPVSSWGERGGIRLCLRTLFPSKSWLQLFFGLSEKQLLYHYRFIRYPAWVFKEFFRKLISKGCMTVNRHNNS